MSDTEYLERTLTTLFRNALGSSLQFWEETQGNDSRAYDKVHSAFNQMCDAVSRQMEQAYPIAAELIAGAVCCEEVPRNLRSVILTALARWPYDISRVASVPIRGRSVSHFARMLNLTSDVCAEVYVQWFEDMDNGIPVRDGKRGEWVLQPQPTRVMRGILFDARLQNDGMTKFWDLATESEHFPVRLFIDPGDNDAQSCYLTNAQLKQMASFIALAPEDAVIRFATEFRDHVRTMDTIVYASIMLPGGMVMQASVCDMGEEDVMELFHWLGLPEWRVEAMVELNEIKSKKIPVKDENRERILQTVVEQVGNPERRKLAELLFFGEDGSLE